MATRFILNGKAGDRLFGEVLRPPQVSAILTDKSFEEISAIIIGGHAHLTPGDGDFIAVARRLHILWRTIHIASDAL